VPSPKYTPLAGRAAPAEAISALFSGQPGGSTSTAPGPADGLFASLAAAATASIDVALHDFDRATVRDALVAARQCGLTVRVVGDNEAAADPVDGAFYTSLSAADIPVVTEVQVAMFTFTNATIAQALIAAHNRGVQVEVLLDGAADGSQFSQRDPLCATGVIVRVETWPGLLHDKYTVIDAGTSSDPLVVTGSANWTANGVEANDENVPIVHDPALASAFAADFARCGGRSLREASSATAAVRASTCRSCCGPALRRRHPAPR
jgi:hypothetical protein